MAAKLPNPIPDWFQPGVRVQTQGRSGVYVKASEANLGCVFVRIDGEYTPRLFKVSDLSRGE